MDTWIEEQRKKAIEAMSQATSSGLEIGDTLSGNGDDFITGYLAAAEASRQKKDEIFKAGYKEALINTVFYIRSEAHSLAPHGKESAILMDLANTIERCIDDTVAKVPERYELMQQNAELKRQLQSLQQAIEQAEPVAWKIEWEEQCLWDNGSRAPSKFHKEVTLDKERADSMRSHSAKVMPLYTHPFIQAIEQADPVITEEMITAYLQANDKWYFEADKRLALPQPREATRDGLKAAITALYTHPFTAEKENVDSLQNPAGLY